MGKIVAVFSGKGGVGKSMLVSALGAQSALAGQRTVLVDLNTGMRCLDMLLGLESRVAFDLGDVVTGVCGLDRVVVEDRETGVHLIAARQFGREEELPRRALEIILEVLATQYELVLLDLPSGTGRTVNLAACMADVALLVTTPDDVSLRDAERISQLLRTLDRPSPLLVVNRVEEGLVKEGLQYTPQVCAEVLDLRLLGVVPEDARVWRDMLAKKPITGGYPAAEAVGNLRLRLADDTAPLFIWQTVPAEPVASDPPVARPPTRRSFFRRLWQDDD